MKRRSVIRLVVSVAVIALAGLSPRAEGPAADAAQFPAPIPPVLPGPPAYFELTSLDAGTSHTCGVARDNRAWCWGLNDRGQLGNHLFVERFSARPIRVGSAFNPFVAVSAGLGLFRAANDDPNQGLQSHTCGLAPNGGVACWGSNTWGQLGTGDFEDSFGLPVGVRTDVRFRSVSAGGAHTCAVSVDYEVHCWGLNHAGQLGNPDAGLRSNVPVRVVGLGGYFIDTVTAGADHTCAADRGLVLCWGSNRYGQLGNGGTASSGVPAAVPFTDRVFLPRISAGFEYTCGADYYGGGYCWGRGDTFQLGYTGEEICGGVQCSTVPRQVLGEEFAYSEVSAGGAHTCALTRDRQVVCWGLNTHGALGIGATPGWPALAPTAPALLLADAVLPGRSGRTLRVTWGARAVAAGGAHSCALAQSRVLFCWGANDVGQVGAATGAFFHDRPVAIRR